MRIIILRAGDAVAEVAERRGQFAGWIKDAVGDVWQGAWLEHDVRTEQPLPSLGDVTAFVITGSSSSVTERAPWMLRVEEYIRQIVETGIPLFGICFGHQLIAQALGGEVARNPNGREIGTVAVRMLPEASSDPLFEDHPHEFDVNCTHVDSVVALPQGAKVLACTELEPHAAFAIGERVRAVQFHPEIDGDVMRGYVKARAHLIDAEGLDSKQIHERVKDTPHGGETLRNFIRKFVLESSTHGR